MVAITTLLLSHFSFFAFGNSNAISSIDLSNAYNGVSGYNVIAVGFLLFASNWAGPIWWACAGVCLLLEEDAAAKAEEDASDDDPDGLKKWIQEERERLRLAALAPEDSENRKITLSQNGTQKVSGQINTTFTTSGHRTRLTLTIQAQRYPPFLTNVA